MQTLVPVAVVALTLALLYLVEKRMHRRFVAPPLPGVISGAVVLVAILAGRAVGDAFSLGAWWALALTALLAGLGYISASLVWAWRKA
ncbi:hypothetical protein [Lysobacter sp. A3-1-A15]|uniref:hypothetical protein n=1 Tax=Novilysobacter viscosus TaxID=3098602 RepID=UPI002ED9DCC8